MLNGRGFISGDTMASDRIRVRLRGFDIELIDQSAKSIVDTVVKAGAEGGRSGPVAHKY